jgi:hypothetical protein
MSNLSDLLPAGAGAKVITATADGNLATGQTVILQSDGTVKAVEATTAGFGSAAVFESASTAFSVVVYDSYNDKLVVFYSDAGDSNKGKAAVGTVTGNSISWGTPVQFSTGNDVTYIGGTYDPDTYKAIVVYKDGVNSNYGTANVGTVSGTSISFGTKVVYESASVFWNAATYDTSADKVVVAYRDAGDSDKGKAIVGTVSGTSISFGSATDIDGGESNRIGITFDTTNNKVIIIYQGTGIEIISGTVSGTSISFGSSTQLDTSTTNNYIGIAYNATDDKFLAAWHDSGSSGVLTIQAGNTSGSGFSVGSAVTVSGTNASYPSIAYDSSSGIFNVAYQDQNQSSKGYVVPVTLSGTTVTTSTAQVFGTAANDYIWAAYNSSAKNTAIVYKDQGNSSYGTGIIWANAGSTSDNFAGITNQAINNSASGEVVVEGGVITNASLLPLAYTGSLGSAAVYQSTATEYQGIAFDSSNNKIVVAYKDDSNQHGTAAVGTVSGTGITWGTPVVFAAASTSYVDVTFDSSNNKVVIVYSDVANSEYGTAIVGTVSGTSISFGSEVVFASAATVYIKAGFDSNSNKVVVAYSDNGNSSYGTAIVGTVSGTSISFGTEVVFDSTGTLSAAFGGFVFDSTNNKIVIPYTRATSFCIVGTVSGTSISFGTTVAFGGTIAGQNLSVAFDSNAGKVVINYRDSNNSDYFGSLVGTVSGTSISFGTELVIEEVHNLGATTFDSSDNTIVYFYKSSSLGYYRIGTVSGTSISYGSAVSLISNNIAYMAATFDSNQNTSVVVYKDAGNSNYGTAKGLQVSGAVPNFTIGSTYYVQNDGTLGTGSTSVTAGKAIANTTLLLKG